jgi:hypothetical protein
MNWVKLPSGKLVNLENVMYIFEYGPDWTTAKNETGKWGVVVFSSNDKDSPDLLLGKADFEALYAHIERTAIALAAPKPGK